ncbi:hypothetical protein ZIOFF_061628 [Zingiber officinale]|uniref:Kinesin-like protein n=2 Tax=Zingiber officinale TaxID=94328 RepID=A0A8J5K8K4_ZINOF|nr:hypothetical protein ZIOFF_061628 [Zingiber officinale]
MPLSLVNPIAQDCKMGSEEMAEEKFLVSVRLRPINAKEIEKNDPADWDCVDGTSVVFKPYLPERSLYPSSYTFDRVFGCACDTRQVYDEGAKEVALSVLHGINASIFAYGQTSSGKTYTMCGITAHTVDDIYDYIRRHGDREYVLKFSAIEIYNEAVRDLLIADSLPLRLLDDPERGTVVDKLTEETLRDQWHLNDLLAICAAQRQVGETSLNEMSSRSHQILRLTVQSTAREFTSKDSSSTLLASVNFVDLAGSERAASQVSSASNRIKEGCHINRSLLTLGTVIRKLSKGRSGHIPFRDSKLTRILQPYLGGNARTAIICTMSPARSHIEQSRNTLLFASCAKQVVTNAKVNVMMSDKAFMKHLQREISRLENELRHAGFSTPNDHSDVLQDKDAQIKKMECKIKELMLQRDFAQSRLNDLLQAVVDEQSRQWEESTQASYLHARSNSDDTFSISGLSGIDYQNPQIGNLRCNAQVQVNKFSYHEPLDDQLPPSRTISNPALNELTLHQTKEGIIEEDSEEHCKEVRCVEIHALSDGRANEFNPLNAEREGLVTPTEDTLEKFSPQYAGCIDCVNRADENLNKLGADEFSQSNPVKKVISTRESILTRSNSCMASLMNNSVFSLLEDADQDHETTPKFLSKGISGMPKGVGCRLSIFSDWIEESKASEKVLLSNMAKTADVDEIVQKEIDANVISTEVKNVVDGNNEQPLFADQETQRHQLETIGSEEKQKDGLNAIPCSPESPLQWQLEFLRKQEEIIQLWHACHVSLVHRSCFFLLFKGDTTDSFYMEVECRRLSLLKNIFSHRNASGIVAEDGSRLNPSSSMRYLRQERYRLCKLIGKVFSPQERESLYAKWGISLNSKKRRIQLSQLMWTETDIEHVKESASLVAKLVGFVEQGEETMKEMFGLNFAVQQTHKRSFSWMQW